MMFLQYYFLIFFKITYVVDTRLNCLDSLYTCEKFHNNISNCFQLTEQTWVHGRNGYVQCSKGNNSKSKQTRVTVHVFRTSSRSVLHLCEVSWKYLVQYQSYGTDTNDGSTDGQTDTQNTRGYDIIPLPLFVAGHKNPRWPSGTMFVNRLEPNSGHAQ